MAQVKEVWPNPAPLEGVKSQKRAIFKVANAEVPKAGNAEVPDQVGGPWTIAQVAVALESRIAAIGEGSRALVDLLLSNVQENSGSVSRHASLSVAHLSPHLAGAAASMDDHAAAIAATLKVKPQIVVLEEACAQGGAGWAKMFHELIRGQAISAYRGAVIVVCSHEATFAVRRICSEQWSTSGNQVQQQETPGRQLQIIEDALKQGSVKASPDNKKQRGRKQTAGADTAGLLEQARTLSEYWFEEDLVEASRAEGWKLALLVDETPDESGSNLKGFMCYHMEQTSAGKELQIERLAVPKPSRRRGLGSVFMRWIISEARRMPSSECSALTCNALSNVVGFYETLGFTVNTDRQVQNKNEEEDPPVFMELPNSSMVSEKENSSMVSEKEPLGK